MYETHSGEEKTLTMLCDKYIQNNIYQILPESTTFYRRHDKNILVCFFGPQCILVWWIVLYAWPMACRFRRLVLAFSNYIYFSREVCSRHGYPLQNFGAFAANRLHDLDHWFLWCNVSHVTRSMNDLRWLGLFVLRLCRQPPWHQCYFASQNNFNTLIPISVRQFLFYC